MKGAPLLAILLCATVAQAGTDQVIALTRDNATNFKDRALAFCVARAYADSPAGQDAASTAGIFLDWTYFDLPANDALDSLITRYLQRDYSTPIEGFSDAKFALLKCIDLYHSRDLDELVGQYVRHPNRPGHTPPGTTPK